MNVQRLSVVALMLIMSAAIGCFSETSPAEEETNAVVLSSEPDAVSTDSQEAAAQQRFLNRRVEELVAQSQAALALGDLPLAKSLADRAAKIDKATNRQLIDPLLARIQGYELARSGSQLNPNFENGNQPSARISSDSMSWAEVVERAKPGIVVIASEFDHGISTGTGFIVNGSYVVTNDHVIADPDTGKMAKRVMIRDSEGRSSLSPGYLIHDRTTDIAVLELGHNSKPNQSLVLSSTAIRQGDEVAAIGHPKGYEFSFTMGYVSAVRRATSFAPSLSGVWVQHSAPISMGNSGGPLLNRQAEVVAMNSWYHDEGKDQNLNFGISAADISEAVERCQHRSVVAFHRTKQSEAERKLYTALQGLLGSP